jgi:hypothetical protein
VHGDKSWTESPDFKKLLGELEKKQSENKPVTKEEIDWLVEQLANMQAFNPAGYLSLPIVDQLQKDSKVHKQSPAPLSL